MTAAVIFAIWVPCSILNMGLLFGHLQKEWPQFAYLHRWTDLSLGAVLAFIGPVATLVLLLMTWPWRFKLTFMTREESLKAYEGLYPSLHGETWRELGGVE